MDEHWASPQLGLSQAKARTLLVEVRTARLCDHFREVVFVDEYERRYVQRRSFIFKYRIVFHNANRVSLSFYLIETAVVLIFFRRISFNHRYE